jgi:hypothetical protein
MPKRGQTKAQAILADIATDMEKERQLMSEASTKAAEHRIALAALERTYNLIEKSLARTPRKSTKKKPEPTLLHDVSKVDKCSECDQGADGADHFKPSPNFHEFQGNKAAKAGVA